MPIRLTTDDFIYRATLIHEAAYDYSLVQYTNSTTKVRILCEYHGEFIQQPSVHLNGCGCPKCTTLRGRAKLSLTTENFIHRAQECHGDTYDYVSTVYINDRVKVEITCKMHGVFLQIPGNHLRGSGCHRCSAIARGLSLRSNTSTFIALAMHVHHETYDYSEVVYQTDIAKVLITCKSHGVFAQSPNNHLAGSGCPNCARESNSYARRFTPTGVPTILYYVYFPEYNVWKIGCTSKGISQRFRAERSTVEIISTKMYEDSRKAYFVERYLLVATHIDRALISPLKGGNTELRVKPIENIIDMIRLAEMAFTTYYQINSPY